MKPAAAAIPIILLWALPEACHSSAFQLENGYFSISGSDGVISCIRFDPAGEAHYGSNHILSFCVGSPVPDPAVTAEADPAGSRLVLRGAKIERATRIEQQSANSPQLLQPGHTLGQTFEFGSGSLNSVQAYLPTWNTTESSVTLTLYRIDGDKRTKIASRRLENVRDNEWVEMSFEDQPAGAYLLELSDVKGRVGWWSSSNGSLPGEALTDGEPQPRASRCIRCRGREIITGDFEINLVANKLRSRFLVDGRLLQGQGLDTELVIPWVKAGYDTTSEKIIFHHFVTNRGIYMPVHQFKRRPYSGVSGEEVLMSGRFGADLKFTNANIHLTMADDSMKLTFPGAEREIEVLPHARRLSQQFPVFFSSDSKIDKVLNEFLLSHNFNFGVGTNPDWKDWHTLQLAWTANHQADLQHLQFLNFKMDPDGCVYTWGADRGWPFPYKDEDKDGENDFDTRHFTTNPCYILGAWREYCWSGDSAYLAKLMPRVRSAMDFMLSECDGSEGVLTIKAPGHEGRDRDIGSNYWDITPFGWKDAFTNAHYYPCLEAMAQLEEAALTLPDHESAENGASLVPHTPYYYRRLAEKVRKSYNETFWLEDKGRYAGCVDVDGVTHDYGFTYVNLPAMAYGLADPEQVARIYDWMENGLSASGRADIYSRWVFAPRASTIYSPRRDEPQEPAPSWWCMVWDGTPYDDQCQAGGAILYTSFHDILARAKYLGADNARQRFVEILDRYSKPDHLSGGSPLYYGEATQGGPGGSPGSVGVEGEFPESGLVPVSFLYAFLGIDADIHGLKIRPKLPSALEFAGVRNLRYRGNMYDIRVTNSSVEVTCTTRGAERTIKKVLAEGETFRL